MSAAIHVLAVALVLSFVLSCVFSGILQVLAWSRHAREGVPVSFRALRNPEAYFDEIGTRQILLARRLLSVGAVAYLTYGLLMVVTNVL